MSHPKISVAHGVKRRGYLIETNEVWENRFLRSRLERGGRNGAGGTGRAERAKQGLSKRWEGLRVETRAALATLFRDKPSPENGLRSFSRPMVVPGPYADDAGVLGQREQLIVDGASSPPAR